MLNELKEERFLVGKNGGPELMLSSMLGGTGNIFADSGTKIRVERDDFNTKNLLASSVASIHGRLNETRQSIVQGILNSEVPFDRRAHRVLLRQWMSPLARTVSLMNASQKELFLVLHPETAEWLTQKIQNKFINLAGHITPLVENDDIDGSWFHLTKNFPNLKPSDPTLVRRVADRMAGVIGREVGTVLDVDHLKAASRVSVRDATAIMAPQYLHLSGPHHCGYDHNEIFRYVDLIKPRIVVLEGPIPSMTDILFERVTDRHKERINVLVYELTQKTLDL